MTLKEKFEDNLMDWIDERDDRNNVMEQCVNIADDFAIGFLEWGFNNYNMINSYDLKLLLTKYKEEKEL
jgi:hypothetical protein